MKKLVPFVLAVLLFGCKKSDDASASSNAVGTYQMSVGATYSQNGKLTNQTGSGTLSVSRLSDDLYEIKEDYSGFSRTYRARINGTSVSVADGSTESVRINNSDLLGTMSGSGLASTDGKQITINTKTNVTVTGLTFVKDAVVNGRR